MCQEFRGMYHEFKDKEPIKTIQITLWAIALLNAPLVLLELKLFCTYHRLANLTLDAWAFVIGLNLFVIGLTIFQMTRWRGGLRGFLQDYVDRNVIGYDVVESGSYGDARTQRHDDCTAVNPYTVHVKLGGWGGKRVWVAHYGAEYKPLKLELISPGTLIITSKAWDTRCRISVDHLIEVLTITDGEIGASATRILCDRLTEMRQKLDTEELKADHLRQIMREAIDRLDATRRFVHSKEGKAIREWLDDQHEQSYQE